MGLDVEAFALACGKAAQDQRVKPVFAFQDAGGRADVFAHLRADQNDDGQAGGFHAGQIVRLAAGGKLRYGRDKGVPPCLTPHKTPRSFT